MNRRALLVALVGFAAEIPDMHEHIGAKRCEQHALQIGVYGAIGAHLTRGAQDHPQTRTGSVEFQYRVPSCARPGSRIGVPASRAATSAGVPNG